MPVLSYSGEYPWAGVVGAQAVGVARQAKPEVPGYGPRHRALLVVPPNGPQKQYMRRYRDLMSAHLRDLLEAQEDSKRVAINMGSLFAPL